MHTDEHGFVKSNDGPVSERRIVVLGDSVVEGMFVDEDDRLCAKLEALLNRRFQTSLSVLNAGYSGATLLHSFNVFLNKIVPLRPEAVVLMSGFVDVDVGKVRKSFWSTDCWLEPIVDVDADNTARDKDLLGSPDYSDREKLLELVLGAAGIFQVPLIMATVPHRFSRECEYTRRSGISPDEFARELGLRKAVNQQVRQIALRHGIPLIDLEIGLMGNDHIFYDAFHLHAAGSHVVANEMAASDAWTFLRSPR